MTQVKIISLNARGIANETKRRKLFKFLKHKDSDIVLLQETHSKKGDTKMWRSLWGSNLINAHGTSASAGVAILLNKRLNYELGKISIDPEGRYIIMDITINDKTLTIINVYAPNSDTPQFFIDLFNTQKEHSNNEIIIGGDFNFIFDSKIDCTNEDRNNNTQVKSIVEEYSEQMMLVDIFRQLHPDERKFTWSRKNPKYTASRIDFFLVNYGLVADATANIECAPTTDHDLITLQVKIDNIKRGRSYWKINNSMLKESSFVNTINEVIDEAKFNISCQEPDEAWEIVKTKAIQEAKKLQIINANKGKKSQNCKKPKKK